LEGELAAGVLLVLLALAGTETPEHAVSQSNKGKTISAALFRRIVRFAQLFRA
jgi:hypothetical protein